MKGNVARFSDLVRVRLVLMNFEKKKKKRKSVNNSFLARNSNYSMTRTRVCFAPLSGVTGRELAEELFEAGRRRLVRRCAARRLGHRRRRVDCKKRGICMSKKALSPESNKTEEN